MHRSLQSFTILLAIFALAAWSFVLYAGEGEEDSADVTEAVYFEGHKKPASCLAFSPDGKYLVSSGDDARVIIRKTSKLDEPKVIKPRDTGGTSSLSANGFNILSFDSKSRIVFAAGNWKDFSIAAIGLSKGEYRTIKLKVPVKRPPVMPGGFPGGAPPTLKGGMGTIRDLGVLGDGKAFLAVTAGSAISLFDGISGKRLKEVKLTDEMLNDATFAPKCKYIAIRIATKAGSSVPEGGYEFTMYGEPYKLRIFDSKLEPLFECELDSGGAGAHEFGAKTNTLYFLTQDGKPAMLKPDRRGKKWEWSSPEWLEESEESEDPAKELGGHMTTMAVSPDERYMVWNRSAGMGKAVLTVCDLESGALRTFTVEAKPEEIVMPDGRKALGPGAIRKIAIHPKNEMLALGLSDGKIAVIKDFKPEDAEEEKDY